MNEDVLFNVQGPLGVITLNRPHALNALTLSMIRALQSQLAAWQINPDIHAIIIQAAPGKAFCAGGDVRWLYEAGLEKNPEQLQFFEEEYRLNRFIHELKKPYIALMNGFTLGGGVGISLHGSHRVAGEKFIFSMPETAIGLFPDIGASYLLSRCPGKIGLFLGLTGHRFNGQEAYEAGLVDYVIHGQHFQTLINQLGALDLSVNAHEQVTSCLTNFVENSKDAIQLSRDLAHINQYFSANTLKQLMTALEQSNDKWALAWYEKLSQKSPISMEVTFVQITNAAHLSMKECIDMDYCLVKHFMKNSDFYEGVRAIIIDKDNRPNWQPNSIKQITTAMVNDYFE